jgi:Uma2 family endonuclease
MQPPPLLPELPTTLPYRLARISVELYHTLVASGLIAEDDPIELLDGVLVEKGRKNPTHAVATGLCDLALLKILPAGWHVRIHDPITLSTSEPEPDLVVVRGRLQDFSGRHPGADDIGLVIEVADASLLTDRYKGCLYAAAGIPCYWLVNLADSSVEVYSRPDREAGEYLNRDDMRAPGHLSLQLAGEALGHIAIESILPQQG